MSRSRLPPLNAIKAFEAAARLGSFTHAADELNVTHGVGSSAATPGSSMRPSAGQKAGRRPAI
jgi:LysR family glycine cleavage system transcriptional activator